ncbi:MAG: alpha-N-arabinofuranosidase [Planctomycetes bacterium]|nr:alpha-N-arabinofuranosidase [Planctomycetota bacterium]
MSRVRISGIVFLTVVIGAGSCLAREASQQRVVVDTTNRSAPICEYVYGQFIEHLGRCIDGGIWAEMLKDRKFYYPVGVGKSTWRTVGDAAAVVMQKENSYVGEQTPQVRLAKGKPPRGIGQGRLGLIKGKEYTGRIVLAGSNSAKVKVSLVWGAGENQRQTIRIKTLSAEYRARALKFTSGGDSEDGRLEIVGTGSGAFSIGTVSLMPADNIEGMRADTFALLKELNSPIYRWPGGNFVSGYDWRDGVGERDKRPPRPNLAWPNLLESNDFGINEFMTFCRLLDTEPYIAVNSGFGDAHSAAKEVEYVNASADTPMGRLRAANGHAKPYNVKWWGIGNEMYGNWQLGYMKLNHYVQKHNRFAIAMRKVDPSIRIVGVGSAGNWSEGMLKSCAEYMELISEHFYCDRKRKSLTEYVSLIRDNVRGKVTAHRDYRKRLGSLEGKDIRIAIDEWNYWYGSRHYNMKDAMGIAAGLHEMFRSSDLVFMANYAQTVNVIGAIKTSKTAAAFDTTGLVLKLYRNRFGQVPVAISGADLPLDVAAALSSDGKTLTIGIVNPTERKLELPLRVKGAMLTTGGGRRWQISDPDPMAHNEPGKEPGVTIKETVFSEGVVRNLAIPPISVSIYKLPLE